MSIVEPGAVKCVSTDELPWRPSAFAPGVFVKDIATTDGWEMQIVRFEPGARFPPHTHEWRSSCSSCRASSFRPAGD